MAGSPRCVTTKRRNESGSNTRGKSFMDSYVATNALPGGNAPVGLAYNELACNFFCVGVVMA